MTITVDQKIGHDAEGRYETLRKELESLRIEVDGMLRPLLRTKTVWLNSFSNPPPNESLKAYRRLRFCTSQVGGKFGFLVS
jgi:hypothetical protein